MNLLNDKIAAALKEGGLSPDTLKPIYTCPVCRDEGYLFDPSRHMCACMERELNRRILGEAGLQDDRRPSKISGRKSSATCRIEPVSVNDNLPDGLETCAKRMPIIFRMHRQRICF